MACHTRPAPAGKAIAPVGSTCLACHTRDDKHDGAFGTQCERCHTTVNWKQVTQRMGGHDDAVTDRLLARLGEASWFVRRSAPAAPVRPS